MVNNYIYNYNNGNPNAESKLRAEHSQSLPFDIVHDAHHLIFTLEKNITAPMCTCKKIVANP